MLLGLVLTGGALRLREASAAVSQWIPGGLDDVMNVAVMTILVLTSIAIPATGHTDTRDGHVDQDPFVDTEARHRAQMARLEIT